MTWEENEKKNHYIYYVKSSNRINKQIREIFETIGAKAEEAARLGGAGN